MQTLRLTLTTALVACALSSAAPAAPKPEPASGVEAAVPLPSTGITLIRLEIAEGRLIIEGTTEEPKTRVTVDGEISVVSKRDRSFRLSLLYQTPDCQLELATAEGVDEVLVGNCGQQGERGKAGKVGPTGPRGAAGPEGAVGPAGPTGNTGAPGPQGAIGPQGPDGPAGPSGIVTTLAFAGPIGPLQFVQAPGESPGTPSYVFAGPTATITVTNTQRITVFASAALGPASDGSSFFYGVCHQLNGSGVISNFQLSNEQEFFGSSSLNSYASGATATLNAGTYNVGACAKIYYQYSIENNTTVNGWVLISN